LISGMTANSDKSAGKSAHFKSVSRH